MTYLSLILCYALPFLVIQWMLKSRTSIKEKIAIAIVPTICLCIAYYLGAELHILNGAAIFIGFALGFYKSGANMEEY